MEGKNLILKGLKQFGKQSESGFCLSRQFLSTFAHRLQVLKPRFKLMIQIFID